MGSKIGSVAMENGLDLYRLDCPRSHCCLQEEFYMVNQREMQPNDSVGSSCWDNSGSGLRRAGEQRMGGQSGGSKRQHTSLRQEKKVKPSKFQLQSHENHSDSAGKVLI